IEKAMDRIAMIDRSVVLLKEDGLGEKVLVGYIVCNGELNTAAIRTELLKWLPSYMIPSYFVSIAEMPLTSNGKLDKKALQELDSSELSTGISYVGPRNEVERQLIKVWEGVLGKQGIGIRDNFFGLGGDSIKSIQVVSRLKQEGYSVKLGDILSYTSIAELSGFVTEIDQEIDQSEVLGAVLLTPIQHYFFSNPLNKVLTHYNQSVLLKSTKEISIDILDQTLSLLVGHHDVLRMSYKEQDNNWHQFNGGIKGDHYSVV